MKKVFPLLFFLTASAVCADPVRVDVSKQDCFRLMTASADYVAGVSVTGQPVVPADLNAPDFENVTIPVYLERPRDFPFQNLSPQTVPLIRAEYRDGQVFVNGTPVPDKAVNDLKNACKKSLEK